MMLLTISTQLNAKDDCNPSTQYWKRVLATQVLPLFPGEILKWKSNIQGFYKEINKSLVNPNKHD